MMVTPLQLVLIELIEQNEIKGVSTSGPLLEDRRIKN